MVKNFAKYMGYGKLVESLLTGEVYKLIENMSENKDTVQAVNVNDWRRYDLLAAWERNYKNDKDFRERFAKRGENIEDCKTEREGYVTELQISNIKPHNKIRFIDTNYNTKFLVEDLQNVIFNGKSKRVIYYDDYHFSFEDGRVFHICEFAELCEKNNIEVFPVEKK